MPYNDYQYLLSTLYSVYSLPNTVLPFVFGSLVDRFGPQRVLLGLSACVCIGQTIFSVGVQTRQIWMMLVGRAIFGVGGESCGVAQASITTMHFRGHELAFALGLNLCIARFDGSSRSVPDSKEHELDMTTPLLSTHFPRSSTFDQLDSMPLYLPTSGTDETLSPTLVKSPSHPAILQHLPGILRREASFSESIRSVRFRPGYTRSGTRPSLHIVTVQDEPKQRPRFQQQRKQHHDSWWGQWVADLEFFPSTFWLICALVVLLYGTVVPFNNIASDFLQTKWYHDNPRKAAAVMGIPDTLGAILVPGFGLIVDKYGGRASTLIASAAIMVVVHTTLGFTSLSPIFAFSLLGVAYSMYGVALWPSIACVVTNELHLGKGYGISTSFLNISLTIAPPIVATIRVIGDSFIPVEMFFIAMGLCGIIVGFALKNIDRRDGGALENPEIQVDVPVIVPQTAASASTSTVASPVPSQSRSRFGRQKKRPALNYIQALGSEPGSGAELASGSGSLWTPKRWQNNLDEGSEAFGSPRSAKSQGGSEGDIGDSSQDSPLVPSNSIPLLLPRITKTKKWFGKPLLQRTLPRVGSPLLQQYSSSPRRYGSFSSPSIASTRIDGEFDLEEGSEGGEKQVTVVEDYSVTQHPILYNPLRGSSGSFRISRNAKPIAFGEGEEGLIYLNGQEVELGYDDNNNNDDDDVEYQSGSEQDYGDEEFDDEGDNDVTEHGSEVDERRGLGIEYNSNNNRSNQDGLTKSDSTANTIAPDSTEET
ncbi:hypothetical protein EC957_005201 [Mortierella hygrophila]|uniref:Lysosomal dipeptide transporter MFSD1 n=1 Tax=Mortierella hygrophila TaxID=979708 RepID=A0A9P6EZM5_9FUNG|nr:hypothetical protein EC957_005201 [Mortierella hygrophila]